MGIFSKLFQRNRGETNSIESKDKRIPLSSECEDFFRCKDYIDALLSQSRFVAKSEFINEIPKYKSIVDFFRVLETSGQLKAYCSQYGINPLEISQTLDSYQNIEKLVDLSNENYLKKALVDEKEYLDNIMKSVDPNVLLDEDQRRVILSDEDYSLVIAGAGAGKTTTVAAKVKYLVEKKDIKPEEILVISFTNKAVGELREKINDNMGIPCPIATFHSTGNAILHKQSEEKLNIVSNDKLYFVIQDYFKTQVMKNERTVNNLIMFFASYFDAPYEGTNLQNFFNRIAKSNFSTMRSDLSDFQRQVVDARTKKAVTIQSEYMRSEQEVQIANFLFLNNLDYEYEPIYQYDIQFARKPYTPDFVIHQNEKTVYLEHFGITEGGENNRYSNDQLEAYKKAIRDKILLHRKHGTTLIYTFSEYNDQRPITEHLKEELEKAGLVLSPRPNEEIMKMLVSSEENRYIRKLVVLICRFITNFKTNGYEIGDFDRMYHSTQNVRSRLFLNICSDCYIQYQRYLKDNDAVDFEDMINNSARVLRDVKEMKQKLSFKYIIVDEYQDISRQRFDLTKALSEVTDAKIIAVGDDWQSIYAFSGSDITLFTKFKEKMGYASLMKIVQTYRNSQEVIDIAGNFIQKNDSQIKKDLKSPKHITNPVIIYTYDATKKDKDGDNRSGRNYATAHAIEVALGQIISYSKAEGKSDVGSILLLGRFGFDGDQLEKSGVFEYVRRGNHIKSVKYPKLKIDFMTAHASKGLGYDNVIVINGKNETYGFPSKIEDDPVLSFVIQGDHSIDYAEERRLFYVAMTRTKNRVYFIAPEQNPSEFLLEIKADYKNVVLKGNWNEEEPQNRFAKKPCPICGYPMQFRYKNAYGLRLHICTNEPEICGFMTNEAKAGKLSIMKCTECRDGYLIVKPTKQTGKYFLGCTNYSKNGTGCECRVWDYQYYKMFGLTPDPVEPIKPTDGNTDENVRKITPYQTGTKPYTGEVANSSEVKPEIIRASLKKEVIFNSQDLNGIIHTILMCLRNISKKHYYGKTMLLDVLRGSETKRLMEAGFDKCPEYGVLHSVSRENLSIIVDWMIDQHYILRTKGQYPVLHETYEGQHYSETLTQGKLNKLKEQLENS